MNTQAPLASSTPHYAELGGPMVVVAGAAKGIGQGIALRLAREGTVLVAADIAVAFLASTDASYITGQVIHVDGGITAQLSLLGQPL